MGDSPAASTLESPLPTDGSLGEIRPHSSDDDAPSSSAVRQSLTAPRQTLEALLAEERRQEQAEKGEKATQARRDALVPLGQLVHAALPDGGRTMKRLKARAARKHPATVADRLNAIRNGAPKPMQGERRKAFEVLVRSDLLAIADTGGIDPLVAVDKMAEALEESILGQGILPSDRQLLDEVLDGLSIDRLYTRLNLKMTDDTMPAFTNAQVLQTPTRLGEGRSNTVYEVEIQNTDGAAMAAVFKPLVHEPPDPAEWSAVARLTGISREDPQTAMRNLATVAYARKLGFHVVTDTRVALINIGQDPFEPALGLVMERAQGRPAEEVEARTLVQANVCAEVMKLQLLDHLTGEADRHDKNYFIHVGQDGRAKVMGIDNDNCFGAELTAPDGAQPDLEDPQRRAFHGTALPPVVDTDMERAILALTEEDIRSMLDDKLNDAEIAAAIQRYQGVRQHLTGLRDTGGVIEPHEWGRPDVLQRLTPANSYLGRELEFA
ncbi:hypothetical protein M4R22_03490 [Acidovorax sp. GBBC 3334]|uniref:hypothetical protein n=1 Tax=Acidovorax sp. GBBC 3334 TaxID=2940496 RepID=UPI002304CDE2|nr:hypothetical protein [Acidovorax sp. GBBC 3334]MDA8453819.1 hypothetical protein [Acidovorax sp. GBBC 3334]